MEATISTYNPIHGSMFSPSNKVGTRGNKTKKFSEYFTSVPGYAQLLADEKKKKKKEGSRYQEPLKMFGYRVIPTIRHKF